MNKIIGFIVLSLAVGSLSQGVPTISNPCLNTSSQPPEYNSMPEQIRLALQAAHSVNSTFQSFKEDLRPVLISSQQCDLESSLDNIPGLPLIHDSNTTTLDIRCSPNPDAEDISSYIMHMDYMRTVKTT